MRFLRKYFWQFTGSLLAIAAIIATYDVFFRSRASKELQIVPSTPLSLVDIKPEAARDIEILFRGKPVSNLSLLQIQIRNSGNQPIVESDYSRPLSFSFAPNDEILDVAVAASDPPNIGMMVNKTSNSEATASSMLLNPQDNITVRFLIKGSTTDSVLKEFRVDGRIAGVKNIEIVASNEQDQQFSVLKLVPFLFLGALLGIGISIFEDWIKSRLRRRKKSKLKENGVPTISGNSAV